MRKIMRAFLPSQFSYCPQIWMFSDRQLNNRIIHIHIFTKGLCALYIRIHCLISMPCRKKTRHVTDTILSRYILAWLLLLLITMFICSFHVLLYLLRPRSYGVFHMCRAQLLYSIHVKYGV